MTLRLLAPEPRRIAATPRGRRGRARGGALLGCLVAALACAACTGPEQVRREREEREELSTEMLRELLEQGTIRPVTTMGDPYAELEADMAPTPEELAGEEPPPEPVPDELATDEPPIEPPAPDELPVVDATEFVPPYNPWAEFGSRIAYDEELGVVTKPYPLRPGMGPKLLRLAQEYGGFDFHDPAEGALQPQELDLVLKENFDQEVITPDLRGPLHAAGALFPVADWLVARARPDVLREFEYFLNTFIATPPQIEIEAKIVEVVTRDTFDLGISDFTATLPEKVFFDTFSFDLPNRGTNELLLNVGTIHDGATFSALVEVLSTYENVSIISEPRGAVREGARAKFQAIETIPYLQIASVNATGGFNTALTQIDVGVRLFVTPRLIGSKVALEIEVEASQQTGEQITAATDQGDLISTPILSTRRARTLVYLKPGQAVILGGLITERTIDEERKVPFFGDLPAVGALFRSTFQSKGKAQVLFFIRPRVLQGADLNREF